MYKDILVRWPSCSKINLYVLRFLIYDSTSSREIPV